MKVITQKETEIGLMPNEWKITSIGNEFDIQQGKQVSAKTRVGENQKPFLRTANLFWNKIDLSVLDKMNFTAAEELRMTIKVNDVFVCEGGDIGRTALVATELNDIYYQNHLHRLRVKSGSTNPLFFVYWMTYCWQFTEYYNGAGNKTTIPNLSQSRLKALLFPKPEKAEQDSISDILSLIQSAIQKQEQIINTTTELKNALMKKLFTESLHREKTKNTEIGQVPQSWDVKTLREICEKPTYGYTDSASKTGNARFLRITDITEDGVTWDNVPYCNCPEERLQNYLLKDNDIVFARIGATTGKSYIMKNPPVAVYASYLIRVRVKNEINPDFLYLFFNSSAYWQQVDANKKSNLKQGVNGSVLQNLLVPIPSILIQEEAVKTFTALENKINFHKSKMKTLEFLFQSSLHNLMTGKIRIKDEVLNTVTEEQFKPAKITANE